MINLQLIIKGVFLYTTLAMTLLFIAGIDSIYDRGFFFIGAILCAISVYGCKKTISKEEFDILTLAKWLDK